LECEISWKVKYWTRSPDEIWYLRCIEILPQQSAFLVCPINCMLRICSIRNAWLRYLSNIIAISVVINYSTSLSACRRSTLVNTERVLILIYLLTAIGLPPGGSCTVHIYTQTIHRTTQNKQYIERHKNLENNTKILEECGPCSDLASYTLAFALQLTKKHGKTSVRVVEQ
jgi:hypothetical protein